MAVRKARAKVRPQQWNEERRSLFLQTLALTSNVAESERKAGMAPGSAYRERRRSTEFRAAWGEALAEGYDRLELNLLERAIAGVSKRTTKTAAGQVTEEFSDRLGMALLTAHRAAAMKARGEDALVDAETAKQRLARKLAEMHRSLAGEG
ncbi:MAG TPA: hypothetical protein VGC10_06720 [Sphingomonas sp.]